MDAGRDADARRRKEGREAEEEYSEDSKHNLIHHPSQGRRRIMLSRYRPCALAALLLAARDDRAGAFTATTRPPGKESTQGLRQEY
ncbi:hypothetical protein THAOC_28234 [Thalassiosira oceanica]|uniref:Uncharacterized protein n=1 Tax=Thalassiosira oceanica TaxID=159749 RepID=K0RUC0_THAOC|nr:hypothetical protein THAOC_28234 [Thalassiosira oceanica]|eukprot:EJK52481.1 hypothetical protein THAOC_28234 [Thalassiosira oceanica]